MTCKRSWKLGSSKKKTNKNKKKKKTKKQTLLDLPSDLLNLVISFLPLKDNIHASTVCKTLHEACVSVRVPDTSPWLIHFSRTDGSHELYDPSTQKTHNLSFPELSDYRVCYSREGWLLMYNANTFQLLFLNPFTRERIPLPPHWMAYDQRMAFSCAPTSTTCLLFTVTNVNTSNITVKTCCPNAAQEWKTFVFKNRLPGSYHTFEQIVFSNGVFYCLTNMGCVTIFDPCLESWNVLPGRTRKDEGRSNGCFMTEHQGKIFLIYMYRFMSPTVHRLDHTSWEWTERRTLGGLTIYASALSCETRAGQSGIQEDSLCLSVFRGFKRTCIYHKVGEESVISFKWKKLDPYGNIWIMPPLNLLDLPFA
ncbi:unnamed protein product [Microthlaspi erraticum]|uniref:F-box domain-containing protein n=1 Tax=Microthlaspi erraticum TaxID=1685480 RepID=A0A6D2LKD5_9BRAS|nr:unnamed protein product [Microthlaspi erraticum]